MKAQTTLPTLFIMLIFAVQLGFLSPVFYGSINDVWAILQPVEKMLAAMLVPSAFLAVLMIPFNRNRLANVIGSFVQRQRGGQRAKGSNFAALAQVGGFGRF